MSKAEILAELPSLTPEERYEILVKLNELDGDLWIDREDPLTEHEKSSLEPVSKLTREIPNLQSRGKNSELV